MNLDYADLCLLHEPYRQGPEKYKAREEACRAGKARVSNRLNP